MVLWREDDFNPWNAFGFFGQGGAGKSALSFTFARLLIERDGILLKQSTSLKIIDDNFYLNTGRAWSKNHWGSPDKLGKRKQLITYLQDLT